MDTTAPRRRLTTLLVGLLALLSVVACSAPSLHGIHSSDRAVDDRGLAGVWRDDSGNLVLDVTRQGPGHFALRVTMVDDETSLPHVLKLDAHLVELEGARFADLVLSKPQREALFDQHMALALRTHQLVKLERHGDALTLWQLDDVKLRRELAQGTIALDHAVLDHAEGGPRFVLTANTPALQRFLGAHAHDTALFDELAVVHRWVRP
ncbi:MAG: hypothetical protein KC731_10485 [Myxococcales bacterium]|nr:hypothetical protein [Myxococcales bacterium]